MSATRSDQPVFQNHGSPVSRPNDKLLTLVAKYPSRVDAQGASQRSKKATDLDNLLQQRTMVRYLNNLAEQSLFRDSCLMDTQVQSQKDYSARYTSPYCKASVGSITRHSKLPKLTLHTKQQNKQKHLDNIQLVNKNVLDVDSEKGAIEYFRKYYAKRQDRLEQLRLAREAESRRSSGNASVAMLKGQGSSQMLSRQGLSRQASLQSLNSAQRAMLRSIESQSSLLNLNNKTDDSDGAPIDSYNDNKTAARINSYEKPRESSKIVGGNGKNVGHRSLVMLSPRERQDDHLQVSVGQIETTHNTLTKNESLTILSNNVITPRELDYSDEPKLKDANNLKTVKQKSHLTRSTTIKRTVANGINSASMIKGTAIMSKNSKGDKAAFLSQWSLIKGRLKSKLKQSHEIDPTASLATDVHTRNNSLNNLKTKIDADVTDNTAATMKSLQLIKPTPQMVRHNTNESLLKHDQSLTQLDSNQIYGKLSNSNSANLLLPNVTQFSRNYSKEEPSVRLASSGIDNNPLSITDLSMLTESQQRFKFPKNHQSRHLIESQVIESGNSPNTMMVSALKDYTESFVKLKGPAQSRRPGNFANIYSHNSHALQKVSMHSNADIKKHSSKKSFSKFDVRDKVEQASQEVFDQSSNLGTKNSSKKRRGRKSPFGEAQNMSASMKDQAKQVSNFVTEAQSAIRQSQDQLLEDHQRQLRKQFDELSPVQIKRAKGVIGTDRQIITANNLIGQQMLVPGQVASGALPKLKQDNKNRRVLINHSHHTNFQRRKQDPIPSSQMTSCADISSSQLSLHMPGHISPRHIAAAPYTLSHQNNSILIDKSSYHI